MFLAFSTTSHLAQLLAGAASWMKKINEVKKLNAYIKHVILMAETAEE